MPGASSWLGLLPLSQFGFSLNKSEFRDALSLRYGGPLKGLTAMGPFFQKYSVAHAFNCKESGFMTMCHNNLRGFEADMLSKIVNDVDTEPEFQRVTVKIIEGLSRNALRPDLRARGVWRADHSAFIDVRMTNTHSPSQIHLTTESVLKKHEQEKKRSYNSCIINIEHGTFTPLLFFCFWGFG